MSKKTELLDILDQNGSPTGESKKREDVHQLGLWHRTVHLWILNSKGQLLLQQRSKTKDTNPNLWDISVAGHIEKGQTPIQAVLREAEEEIGLVCEESEIEFLFSVQNIFIDPHTAVQDFEFQDVFILKADLEINKLKCQVEEVQALAWVHWSELEKFYEEGDPKLVTHPEEYPLLFNRLALELD